jgi:hypothetical protein
MRVVGGRGRARFACARDEVLAADDAAPDRRGGRGHTGVDDGHHDARAAEAVVVQVGRVGQQQRQREVVVRRRDRVARQRELTRGGVLHARGPRGRHELVGDDVVDADRGPERIGLAIRDRDHEPVAMLELVRDGAAEFPDARTASYGFLVLTITR